MNVRAQLEEKLKFVMVKRSPEKEIPEKRQGECITRK